MGSGSPPGARTHRRGVWGPAAGSSTRAGRRPESSCASSTRRARRPAIAAFERGGSAFPASSRSERTGSSGGAVPRPAASGRASRGCRLRAACVRLRAAVVRSGSGGRGSRDRRSRAGWRPPAARRRAHAPRARGRSLRRRTPRYASIASQLFAYAAEWDSRSTTRMPSARTPRCGRTQLPRGAAFAPRGAVTAGRSTNPRRGTRPAEVGGAAAWSSDRGQEDGRTGGLLDQRRASSENGDARGVSAERLFFCMRSLGLVGRDGSDLGVDAERRRIANARRATATRRRRGGTTRALPGDGRSRRCGRAPSSPARRSQRRSRLSAASSARASAANDVVLREARPFEREQPPLRALAEPVAPEREGLVRPAATMR